MMQWRWTLTSRHTRDLGLRNPNPNVHRRHPLFSVEESALSTYKYFKKPSILLIRLLIHPAHGLWSHTLQLRMPILFRLQCIHEGRLAAQCSSYIDMEGPECWRSRFYLGQHSSCGVSRLSGNSSIRTKFDDLIVEETHRTGHREQFVYYR